MPMVARFINDNICNMLKTTSFYSVKIWAVIYILAAITNSVALAGTDTADGTVIFSASINQSSCVPEFQLSVNGDQPVQLPKIASSNFKKNSLSAVSYFSLKLVNESLSVASLPSCNSFSLLNAIQFDSTPNATSVLGFLKNQDLSNPARNINVELILFNSNWTQQHTVDLQSKDSINFNKIPGWEQEKDARRLKQLNFAVRYTKDATATEVVTPGLFYVVLPFMLKFN